MLKTILVFQLFFFIYITAIIWNRTFKLIGSINSLLKITFYYLDGIMAGDNEK